MDNKNIFLTVIEASLLTNKTEKTIRNCIKELLEVSGKTSSTTSGSLQIETRGNKNRKFYKISKDYLVKRFNLKSNIEEISQNKRTETQENGEGNILREWLNDKIENISLLEKQLSVKDSQIQDKDQQLLVMSKLLENQQLLSLGLQNQIKQLTENQNLMLNSNSYQDSSPIDLKYTPESDINISNQSEQPKYDESYSSRSSSPNIERKWWQIWK